MNSYEFGKTSDGQVVNAYIIENINGIRVEFLNYGCILRQFWVPKSDDSYVNIVYGLDSVADYENDKCFFGALIGRFANRIKNACFELDGTEYRLDANDGQNYLHGCWFKKIFEAHELPGKTLEEKSKGVVFTYRSPDGENGFPGNVDVKVTYILDDNNVLHMTYETTPDRDTVLNLTNHSYFNLGADQTVSVNAKKFLEIGSDIIPTGRILNVKDYPCMDLRTARSLDENTPDIGIFDHCYCFEEREYPAYTPDVVLHAAARGITLEIRTDCPAVQIFSGNTVGVAVEPEMYPCSPNYPDFPSAVVRAGETKIWNNSYKIIVEIQ